MVNEVEIFHQMTLRYVVFTLCASLPRFDLRGQQHTKVPHHRPPIVWCSSHRGLFFYSIAILILTPNAIPL